MSHHNCNPCCPRPAGVVSGEPIGSQLQNFISAFYGEVEVIQNDDGSYSWILPCDLNNAVVGYPPETGEGTACLFARIFNDLLNQSLTFNSPSLANGQNYFVIRNVPFAGTIQDAAFKINSGTATFSVQINEVDVTGLTGLAASSTEGTGTATATNTFAIGDNINIEITAASTPLIFDLTLNIRRIPA